MRTNPSRFATTFFIISLLLANTTYSTAQFYMQTHVGYALPFAQTSTIEQNTQSTSGNTTTRSSANVYTNFGTHLNLALAGGFMFNKYVGLQLGARYALGIEQVWAIETTTAPKNTEKSVASASNQQLRIVPAFIVTTGGTILNVYARMGVVLPILDETTLKTTISKDQNTSGNKYVLDVAKTEKVTGQLGVGYSSALGASLFLNKSTAVFGEVELTTLHTKTARATVTAFTSEEKNQPFIGTPSQTSKTIDNLTTAERETVFLDKIEYGAPDPNAPTKALATDLNFSNICTLLSMII